MLHAMIDLETLDTSVTSAVLSIGVALFNDDGLLSHYDLEARFDLDEQMRIGRTVSVSTIQWWMQQEEAARTAAFGKPTRGVPVLPIKGIHTLLQGLLNGVDQVWCRGLTFDIPILDNMFASQGLKSPWRYDKTRDSRTILDHIPPGALPQRAGVAHNALADAQFEATCVLEALTALHRNYSAFANTNMASMPAHRIVLTDEQILECWRRAEAVLGQVSHTPADLRHHLIVFARELGIDGAVSQQMPAPTYGYTVTASDDLAPVVGVGIVPPGSISPFSSSPLISPTSKG